MKRILDVALSVAMLTVSIPVWPFICIAIKLGDRGPIFFRQERWGLHGTKFHVVKFRSMKAETEQVTLDPALEDDPRVTRVGRALRRTGLDELPQLFNILRGEMSFVGPRALAVGELVHLRDGRKARCEEVPGFSERLTVRPGLTGTTTVYLPKDAAAEDKFESDLEYVRTRSLLGDIRLILISFLVSFRGRWEARGNKL